MFKSLLKNTFTFSKIPKCRGETTDTGFQKSAVEVKSISHKMLPCKTCTLILVTFHHSFPNPLSVVIVFT